MKKILCFLIVSLLLNATDIPMPPSIPNIHPNKSMKQTIKNGKDSCKIIPPMLINLPPMLEDDLDECKNSLYMPTKKEAQKKLSALLKNRVKVKNVTALKGFSMLYKIETERGDFYCNRKIDRCLTSYIKLISKNKR